MVTFSSRRLRRGVPPCAPALFALALQLVGGRSWALPPFAQQTGMPCSQCHTVAFGPALTEYGRQFKENGYTGNNGDAQQPLALMALGGFSKTKDDQPAPPVDGYKTNNNTSIDQVNLFYAGRISTHLGVFSQFTYNGERHSFNWDNTDVRYARALTFGNNGLVAGISVNNNPTVQDLWNSTPAWGFPYIASALVPTPAAAPIINGLGGTTVGATAYGMLNERYYLELGAYKGLTPNWLRNVGQDPVSGPHISGLAPYLRAAAQFDGNPHYFSLGLFGLNTRLQPDLTMPGTDRFLDLGFDGTYQYSDGQNNGIAANASFIHERRSLDASFAQGLSDAANNSLDAFRFDVTYAYRQTYAASVAFFATQGSSNTVLYSPGAVSGSATSSPNSTGYTLQAEVIPFGKLHSFGRPYVNVRLGLQLTNYLKFNGGTTNYDGSGRSASGNDALFFYFWLIT